MAFSISAATLPASAAICEAHAFDLGEAAASTEYAEAMGRNKKLNMGSVRPKKRYVRERKGAARAGEREGKRAWPGVADIDAQRTTLKIDESEPGGPGGGRDQIWHQFLHPDSILYCHATEHGAGRVTVNARLQL